MSKPKLERKVPNPMDLFVLALEHRSRNGFFLKEVVQLAELHDIKVVQLVAYAVWLNTCGLAPHRLFGMDMLSPIVAISSFLRKDPSVYLQTEKLYVETLKTWFPPLKNAGLPGLEPAEKNPIQAIRTHSGKTHLARNVEPQEDHVLLTGVLEPLFNKQLLQLGFDDEHPLSNALSGYKQGPDIKVLVTDLASIEVENPSTFRLLNEEPLAKLAEELIAKTTQSS